MGNRRYKLLYIYIAICGLCGCSPGLGDGESSSTPETATSIALPQQRVVKEITPSYAGDMTDQRRVAGLAEAIFVGKINQQSGVNLRYGHIPYTSYSVSVIEVLKGVAPGMVTVEQQGGRDAKTNTTYIVKDDRPLAVGETYVLATMYRESERTYNTIPVYGDIQLSNRDAAKLMTSDPPLSVIAMRESIANQIPPR